MKRRSRLPVFFRNGEQIDFLALNEHYNFEFQQVTNLGKTKTVKPVGFNDTSLKSDTECMEMFEMCNQTHAARNRSFSPSSHRETSSWWNARMRRRIGQDSLG